MFQLNICMKKFEQALFAAEQQNKLKRVRLKLDPKIREAQDYSQYEGYEGYVLSETETHIELQIKDKRIMLPKVVLENKLTDFIKGAAPKSYATGKSISDKFKDAKNYYYDDPNASKSEKAGRVVGGLTSAALKAANPMTYLRGIERVAIAPTRLLGSALGINPKKNDDTKDFGSVTTFRYTSDSAINIGNTLVAASAYGGTHTNGATNTNSGVSYYTVLDNNQNIKSTYMVINAELLAQFPGRTSYNRQKIPIADVQDVKTIADTIIQLKGSSSSVTIDSNFYNAVINVNAKLQQSINNMDINKKNQIAVEVLHLPSLKTFDIGGALNQKFGDGFVLSEKYA